MTLKPPVALVRGPMVTATALSNLATPSIGLAYLGGCLRANGWPCQIVDAVAEGLDHYWPVPTQHGILAQGLSFEDTVQRIPEDAAIIGVSVMFSAEWPIQRDFIKSIRGRFPSALIVAGGEHITALTEYSLRDCPAIDICVRGEGEQTLLDIVRTHSRGETIGEMVSHIGYRTPSGEIKINGALPRIRDLATIPWPYWPDGYLEKFWRAGKAFGIQSPRDMPMLASRGCPYQCTFCSSPQMWTTRYSLRETDDVIAEIKVYVERFKVTAVQFYDLTAIIKKSWIIEFCQKLLDQEIRIHWSLPSGTRSEALDAEVLSMLHRTGCNFIVYAPESGDPDTLEVIKKKVQLNRLTSSALSAKRLGMAVRANLLIGFPHETRRQIHRTIRYGLYLAWNGIDDVGISLFAPYPGSEIFEDLVQRSILRVNDNYFLNLNSSWTANELHVNEHVGPRELAFYRFTFMLLNYLVGYVRYPHRIIRTVRNIWFRDEAATNFEHFLKNAFRRWRPAVRPAAAVEERCSADAA